MVTALKAQDLTSTASLDARLPTAEMRKVLATLARVADRKSAITMLANVRITVDPSGLVSLAATDLNLSMVYLAHAYTGVSPGSLCVPAKQLADIVKTASSADVKLSKSGSLGMRVASGDSEVTLIGVNPADFPKLPGASADMVSVLADDSVAFANAEPEALATMIDTALPSVCQDETRFHLNGVWIECTGETTRMVSTDGHRLTRVTSSDVKGPRIPGVILPAKAAKEIAKILHDTDEERCLWAVGKTHLFVRFGGWTVMAKLIDAQFPPYEQVIPTDHDKRATVERKTLVAALKRAKKLYRDGRGSKLTFASGKLTITSDNPETGTSVEAMLASSQWLDDGGRMEIGINPGYLLDALDGMADRFVTIAMGDELDPVLVRETEDAIERSVGMSRHLVVIMPMRI